MQQTLGAAAPEVLRDGGAALASLEAEVSARTKRREDDLQQTAGRDARRLAGETPARQAKEIEKSRFQVPGTNMTQSLNVQRLDPAVFAQNVQSNVVYKEVKEPAAPRAKPVLPPRRAPEVEVATSDFTWNSIDVGGRRSLAALRPVVTPQGAAIQGFVVSQAALSDAIRSAGPAAAFLELRPSAKDGIPIGSSGWSLAVDERAAAAPAMARAEDIRRTFRQTFFAGLAAASLALIAVAVLVWRTERLARERAQFAAAAAHELRTPLAGLRLYGDMLAHQLGDPDRSRLYARQVAQEADRLGRVVTNMLEFTRLERGGLSIRAEEGDLGAAVRECIEQLRPALEAAGCSVNLTVADDLPPVAFDRDAVHQIVQNLLDNAEKYSRPSSERVIDVEVARMNGGVGVTVSDRGVGIDARVARHLFLPFERGGGDAPAGLGLGLVLVKALAQAHGGNVEWAARSGGGTTFRVVLPRAG
jgi:signal transduction histidine kinase